MFTRIGFLALWLVASSAAVAVAWAGVSVVDDEIVNPAPAAVYATDPHLASVDADVSSTVEIGSGVDDTATDPTPDPLDTSVTTAPTTTTMPTATTAPTTAPTTTVAAPTTAATPGSNPPPVTPPPTESTVPTTTTVPSSSSTTTTTTVPTTTVPPTYTQQFNLVGGTVVVDFSAAGVTIELAVPNPGFKLETIEPESPGWKVEFRSDSHRSRVDVWWADGPRSEIREEPDDG
jgi:hypothetical protein